MALQAGPSVVDLQSQAAATADELWQLGCDAVTAKELQAELQRLGLPCSETSVFDLRQWLIAALRPSRKSAVAAEKKANAAKLSQLDCPARSVPELRDALKSRTQQSLPHRASQVQLQRLLLASLQHTPSARASKRVRSSAAVTAPSGPHTAPPSLLSPPSSPMRLDFDAAAGGGGRLAWWQCRWWRLLWPRQLQLAAPSVRQRSSAGVGGSVGDGAAAA